MISCREEIFQCVENVKIRSGIIPGRLLVFRLSAEPVLSADKPEDVILAAAQLGQGRIVVFSHDSFASEFMKGDEGDVNYRLYDNVKKWVSRGKVTNNSFDAILSNENNSSVEICSLDGLNQYSIVIFHAAHSKIVDESILDKFIENGGGLIYAITPWGWLELNGDKRLNQAPYLPILHKAGIGFSEDTCCSCSMIETKCNQTNESHILKCLQSNDLESTALLTKVNLTKSHNDLPNDVCEAIKSRIKDSWHNCCKGVDEQFKNKPIKSANYAEKNLLDLWQLGADMCGIDGLKAHGIKYFPGDFDVLPPTSCGQFEFSSVRQDFYHTGCYAPAGCSVQIEILSISPASTKWKAIVGCHVDVLTEVVVRRWPKVSHSYDLIDQTSLTVCSPFGGLITLVSPDDKNSSIRAQISNYVSSPMYKLSDPDSVTNWEHNRNLPGLWANISGKWVTITLPSSSIRSLDDPSPALHFFDQLREAYHDLRGTDNSAYRREWIVTDEQPCAGYMHAGYPIVTHLDVAQPTNVDFLLNGANLRQLGNWGIFHEIGHNMQQDAWTFEGTSEVTVNIFTLFVMDTLCGKKAWVHEWLKPYVKAAVKYFEQGVDFENWKNDPGLALIIYAQLINIFGWDAYKNVMRRYQNLTPAEMPHSNQDKIDLWFFIFSEECGYNLHSMAYFWGIPVSENGGKKLEKLGLIPILCYDEICNNIEERAKFVKDKFPDLIFKNSD